MTYALSILTSGESWLVGSVKADCSNALSTWPFCAVNGSWVALEGSLSSAESYALRPFDASTPRGVGLSLTSSPDLATHSWNADVYTSWSFRKSVSLYGRLGYAQSDALPSYALAALPAGDPRRLRDGVNYGVGVRYDISPALGLRLEDARFPRFAGESVTGPLPDSDQVQFGMQLRF